jgi:hypothetical protein
LNERRGEGEGGGNWGIGVGGRRGVGVEVEVGGYDMIFDDFSSLFFSCLVFFLCWIGCLRRELGYGKWEMS